MIETDLLRPNAAIHDPICQDTVLNKNFTSEYQLMRNEKRETLYAYTIIKDLGEGTFGKVKLASHNHTKEKVAIKVLEKNKIVDEGDRERVSREIQILKILRHPNITQLYEILEDEERLYLINEYAPNGELFDYIVSNQKIREVEACKFFQQIIDGIEYIHRLNVVHRDLKPENLLLDENYNIKIVDFGLSNIYNANELLKTACGSPCYAAPEMIAGRKYSGLQVDIWSSGVILFALLCGYLPFDDNDTQILYRKIMRGEYSVPSSVSPEASDLIKKILNIHPSKRYNLAEIKAHPWFYVYKGYVDIPKGLIVGYNEIPVDEVILDNVESFGYDRDVVIQSIRSSRHNKLTTMYYLLLNKFIRNGHASKADINSMLFRPKVHFELKNAIQTISAAKDGFEETRKAVEEVPKAQESNSQPEKNVVTEILNQHHDRIAKKAERPTITNLNNTSLLSFEENLRDTSVKPVTSRRVSKRTVPKNIYQSVIEESGTKNNSYNIAQLLNPEQNTSNCKPDKSSKITQLSSNTVIDRERPCKEVELNIYSKGIISTKVVKKKQAFSVVRSKVETPTTTKTKAENSATKRWLKRRRESVTQKDQGIHQDKSGCEP